MATILLKNLTDRVNILEQQNYLLSYAKKHRLAIDTTELETSDHKKSLEDRIEFRGFLRSLNPRDTLLIYDFWVLSPKVEELVKICECLLQRDITLHIGIKKEIIDLRSSSLHVLTLLARERQLDGDKRERLKQGRPKGRMSQSKFDKYRSKIISYLEKDYSVSKIASILDVRRTSLKDYINSRNLKVLAKTKQELLGATPKEMLPKKVVKKKCDLIIKDEKDR